jgi:hypothetical protein
MRLAARCSEKLLVSISYVPFRAAGYAKSDHPSPPGCLLLAQNGHGAVSDLSPLCASKRTSLPSSLIGPSPAFGGPNDGLYDQD